VGGPSRTCLAALETGGRRAIVDATKLAHLDDAIAAVEFELSEDEIKRLETPYTSWSIAR
jgi:aryl-alcohol dehydrogenase-like predicted oxidoreductase